MSMSKNGESCCVRHFVMKGRQKRRIKFKKSRVSWEALSFIVQNWHQCSIDYLPGMKRSTVSGLLSTCLQGHHSAWTGPMGGLCLNMAFLYGKWMVPGLSQGSKKDGRMDIMRALGQKSELIRYRIW